MLDTDATLKRQGIDRQVVVMRGTTLGKKQDDAMRVLVHKSWNLRELDARYAGFEVLVDLRLTEDLWLNLGADYVRAEFLKGRNMDYVRASKALGVGNLTIMYRHLLPNGMTPVITFLPFRLSGAILALTSVDFLGLGVPPSTPSLGELLAQGKSNIDAWWLSMSTFMVLVGTLILLIFIGEALRETFDPRQLVKQEKKQVKG